MTQSANSRNQSVELLALARTPDEYQYLSLLPASPMPSPPRCSTSTTPTSRPRRGRRRRRRSTSAASPRHASGCWGPAAAAHPPPTTPNTCATERATERTGRDKLSNTRRVIRHKLLADLRFSSDTGRDNLNNTRRVIRHKLLADLRFSSDTGRDNLNNTRCVNRHKLLVNLCFLGVTPCYDVASISHLPLGTGRPARHPTQPKPGLLTWGSP
jgi:hypothetical protein